MSRQKRAKLTSAEKKVRRLLGRAIQRYKLIDPGDRILVALSGGVDSTSLIWLLHDRLPRIPIAYELVAVHVDLGFHGGDYSPVEVWTESLGISHQIIQSEFGPKAHSPENLENPCFLCARLRRVALFKAASNLGCNKIAFGHNLDDLIETFFINLLYGSQIATMLPRQVFFDGEIIVIRPLALLESSTIRRFHGNHGLPVADNPCPSKNTGARQEIREILQELYRKNRKIRGNILHAMHNVNLEYLPTYQPNLK
ncbi:MAG: tRNA 2-thiocytidine(32) synthetase TtcA [Deltaproteobacteria bacterium]|nr:MAG: tRNA 2-thiocytidine(32) synthetase TtcA [Deltaproteobacteria bacterium]